jgi:hypothetical protein
MLPSLAKLAPQFELRGGRECSSCFPGRTRQTGKRDNYRQIDATPDSGDPEL